MKINYATFPWKSCVLFLALALSSRIQANQIDLVLTEVDDDTLVASGSDGANWTIVGSGNSWTGTRNAPFDGMNPFNYQSASWTEPAAPAYLNFLEMFYYNLADTQIVRGPSPTPVAQFQFHVTSDQLALPGDSPVADGTVVTLQFGVYSEVLADYTVQFIDHAPQTVPDNASTALCLGVGLVSVLYFRRRLAVR